VTMKTSTLAATKGRSGFKRRAVHIRNAPKEDTIDLSTGRDIYRSHLLYGEGSITSEDIDDIPGIEILTEIKRNGE